MRRSKANFNLRLDPHDPRYLELRIGDLPPVRLSAQNNREITALLAKLLPEQERHAAGARIWLPPVRIGQ